MNLRRFVIAVGLLAVAGSASAVDLKSLKKSLGGSESSAQSSEGVSSLGGWAGWPCRASAARPRATRPACWSTA